jgi:1-acyl-sn-glycerol-3-phosphate acyltransferase
MYHLIGAVTGGPIRRLFRFRSTGEEHLPREGGFVLSANHHSNIDPWPLGLPLYPRRQLRFMAKAEMLTPPLKWILEPAGAFPVRRGMGDEEAIRKAVELAKALSTDDSGRYVNGVLESIRKDLAARGPRRPTA